MRGVRSYARLLIGLFLVILTACGGASEPSAPTIKITTLEDGSQVDVGQQVTVGFEAADVEGITQVELTINGEPTYVEAAAPPVNVFTGSYAWTPESPGSYLIQVVTFNVGGRASEPAQVAVRVEGNAAAAGGEPTPTIAPVEELPTAETVETTPTRPLVPPTPLPATPTPTAETVEATAATGDRPIVTMKVGLNVRAGPSTDYPVIGRLAEGNTAEIVGKDVNSAWWQIVFTSEGGDRGWVSADEEFSSAADADNVPVVESPPLPEVAANPTATDPALPVIFSFTAERNTITAGESVVLSWELENAKEAYLRYPGTDEGVVSPGSKRVSPTTDTVYTLLARNDAGETTAEVTIRVTAAAATPVPVRRNGRITLASGQAVDFDEGIVQDDTGSSIDFAWDFQQKGFMRRNGAIGVLVSTGYNDLTFDDCVKAPYGDPITGVDISSAVVGCYRTSDDRLGKFVISEWDLSGKLTIDWSTWDN